jgi:hypothetical protein
MSIPDNIDGVDWHDLELVRGVHRGSIAKIDGLATNLLVYDSFTDTDTTALASHTPDFDSAANGWVDGGGDQIINSNQVEVDAGADRGSTWFAIIDAGEADVIIEAEYVSGGEFALYANAGGTPHWHGYWDSTGLIIREWTGFSYTDRASNGSTGPTAGDRLILTTDGDTISLKTQGSQSYSASYNVASRPNATATSHGIGLNDGAITVIVDNFFIWTL